MCVRCDSDLFLLGTVPVAAAWNNGDMAALCVWVTMGVLTVKAVDVDAIPMKSNIFKNVFFVLLLAIMLMD